MLLAKKVGVPKKYADFSDIFSKKLAAMLLNCLNINNYTEDFEPGKQPSYGPIYSLSLLESEILKTYIETNPTNKFVRLFKYPIKAHIFFVKKPDGSLYLCIDIRG